MSSDQKKEKKKINPALKYSGMAMQMAITIGLGVWFGKMLDSHFETTKPYFTILLSIFFLAAIMYSIIRSVSQDQ